MWKGRKRLEFRKTHLNKSIFFCCTKFYSFHSFYYTKTDGILTFMSIFENGKNKTEKWLASSNTKPVT